MKREIFGLILTLLGGILWGFSGACGQYLFTQKNVNADFLVPYRLLVSGALLVTFYLIKSPKRAVLPIKDIRLLPELLIYSIIGLMMTQYTYFYAIYLSNAGIATVIQYTAPAIILIIVCFNERRFARLNELIALILATLGVVILATHGDFSKFIVSKEALIFAFLSAIGACFYNLTPKRLNKKYPVALVLGWAMLFGGVVLGVYLRVWQFGFLSDFSGFLAFFSVIFFGTILSFSFYMVGVKILGAARASLIACIEPVSATIFAHFWLKTQFLFLDFVGFILIICCVFLSSKGQKIAQKG